MPHHFIFHESWKPWQSTRIYHGIRKQISLSRGIDKITNDITTGQDNTIPSSGKDNKLHDILKCDRFHATLTLHPVPLTTLTLHPVPFSTLTMHPVPLSTLTLHCAPFCPDLAPCAPFHPDLAPCAPFHPDLAPCAKLVSVLTAPPEFNFHVYIISC